MPWWMGAVHCFAFLAGSFVAILVLSLGVIAVVLVSGDMNAMTDPDALMDVMGAGGNGAMAIALHLSIAVSALLLAQFLPLGEPAIAHIPRSPTEFGSKMRETFALGKGRLVFLIPALLGALTIGISAGWLSEQIMNLLPDYPNNLELISKLLTQGTGVGWLIMILAVTVSAPILEELIFRGYLWSVLERAFHPAFAWIGSSLLFMLYHQDPIHIVGLAPTAFFIGWLRWVSGSIWAPMLAHFVNNGLAVALTIFFADLDGESTLPIAVAAFGFTCLVSGTTWGIVRAMAPTEG